MVYGEQQSYEKTSSKKKMRKLRPNYLDRYYMERIFLSPLD